MGVKVSDMTEASGVLTGDFLMIVQNGENKKISAAKFQQSDEPAGDSDKLGGEPASAYLKTDGTAADSNKLGGVGASSYATKQYVDSKVSQNIDPTWACPKLWYDNENLPNNNEDGGWAFCDGRALDPEEYHELFAIIGYKFTLNSSGEQATSGNFKVPDLRGRFILGANCGQNTVVKKTGTLPSNIYEGKDFDSSGQYQFPSEVGWDGGSPVTTQDSSSQMFAHTHQLGASGKAYPNLANNTSQSDPYTASTPYHEGNIINDINDTINGTQPTGANSVSDAKYPNTDAASSYNYSMLSMPPYLCFAWIMRIKPL